MNCDEAMEILNEKLNNININSKLEFLELFDDNTATELDKFTTCNNEVCGVSTAFGYIAGCKAYAYYQDISLNSGAIGKVAAQKIKKVYTLAAQNGVPVVSVFNGNGLFVNEGLDVLNDFGEIIKLSNSISGVVPQIAIIKGSALGSTAVLASLADIKIMLSNSEFYLTSPKIVKDNSVNIGSSDFCANNGLVNFVANDYAEALNILKNVITYLPENNLSAPVYTDYTRNNTYSNESVNNIINSIVDDSSFIEISKNYSPDVITGFATVYGVTVGIIANNAADKYLTVKAAKKATEFIRFLDSFSIPVVSLLDLKGFAATGETEILGGEKAFAALTQSYAEATTQKITLITGYAVGAAFVTIGSKSVSSDYTMALPSACIGALEEMTAVELLYKDRLNNGEDRKALEQEYINKECNAFNAAEQGVINDIVSLQEAGGKISAVLDMLSGKRVNTLNKKHTNMPL